MLFKRKIGGKRVDLKSFISKYKDKLKLESKKYYQTYYGRAYFAISAAINFEYYKKNIKILHAPKINCVESFDKTKNEISKEIKIIYYDSERQLINNIKQYKRKSCILFVNYCGIIDIANLIKKKEFENHTKIIDLANSFVTKEYLNKIAAFSDFSVISLRKFLPLNDTAVLFTRNEIIEKTELGESHFLWKIMIFLSSKKFFNYFLDIFAIKKIIFNILEEKINPYKATTTAINLWESTNLKKIQKIRKNNYIFLNHYLNKFKKKFNFKINKQNIMPLYYPIEAEDCKGLQKYLASNSVYCPLFWSKLDKKSQYLALPIDDRVKKRDLIYIVKLIKNEYCIKNFLNKSNF